MLDHATTSPSFRRMEPDPTSKVPPKVDEAARRALLRKQPCGKLLAQLTAIALKRINGRSLPDAQDFAQDAITSAYASLERGGWDPDRGPLMSYLVARVITAAGAERRRKRNQCEVWLDEEAEGEDKHSTVSRHEKHFAEDKPGPED